MELELIRNHFTDTATIGDLNIDGKHFCYILEDTDRGLYSSMVLDDINKKKVYGKTAIPYGRYQIVVTKSERFSRMKGKDVYLPLLVNVPGYGGIRIHTGNKPEDTEGCLLPGTEKQDKTVTNSTTAFLKLNELINNTIKKGEQVFITIKK
jgi:hypothetical protein